MSELTKKKSTSSIFKKNCFQEKNYQKNNNIKYNRRMWSKQTNILLSF